MNAKVNEGRKQSLVGRRIRLVHILDSASVNNDHDYKTKVKPGDLGTITDISIAPKGKLMISVDWDNKSNTPLIQGEDSYEILD
ncbi:MAG TPA: hypothetical protein VE378_04605 [Nitrososphaeraceae archaeon]|jgi:hypothetical protein|nr:hypothetical protein [Nitrososphaeraceae archaeon]